MSVTEFATSNQSEQTLARPEILAPAGNEEMMRAAVENGADAVYFGLEKFNARMRAVNFDPAELPRIMAWLHERGVKGYVTLNTLIFPSEMEDAKSFLLECSRAGVDAVLVQDIGVASLARALVPELPIHASTQMTVTSAEGARALEAFGLNIERVVAAREMSRKDLARMGQDTTVEIEVFVHGALCVAYSGQCLTSEALGGRSANRGECAQACRLPYDLEVDGEVRDLEGLRYLLSPKDLAAYSDIRDLMEMGIVSLKIEGRYKTPQYVAATVRSYREAIETAMAGKRPEMDRDTRERLEMTFSRGLTGGYIHEVDHQEVVEGRFPKKRGLFLGKVVAIARNEVIVELKGSLKCGDGVVFDAGTPDKDEEGGFVHGLTIGATRVKSYEPSSEEATRVGLFFGDGGVKLNRIKAGHLVWKTSDPKLDAALRATYENGAIQYKRPIRAHFASKPGGFSKLTLWDWEGYSVTVEDTEPADVAQNRPLDEAAVLKQMNRMGDTPFYLDGLETAIEGEPLVPFSRLNDLRRRGVDRLIEERRAIGLNRNDAPVALEEIRTQNRIEFPRQTPAEISQSKLSVLCRELDQVSEAVAFGNVDTIYTDFEDIRLHKEARKLIPRGEGFPAFVPAAMRIVKPGESGFVRTLLGAEPDAILVRNLASWEILKSEAPEMEIRGDFSLNISNDLTAAAHRRNGFVSLVPSYDLNLEQLEDLFSASNPEWFEVTIHQYMPMFHMEHCVFCRFMSDGTDFTNCGRPCEKHNVALKDRMGYSHRLKADAGCRNTVYNAIAQSGSESLGRLLEAGVRRFRVDLMGENREKTRGVLEAYLPAVKGETSGHGLWKKLNAIGKLGVTRGALDHA